MEDFGSTSTIKRIKPGVVVKEPHDFEIGELADRVNRCFSVEPQILRKLGLHPRIVKYLGQRGRGLVLGQASHGNPQTYLDENDSSIDLRQRMKCCRQLTEAIAHIHSHGVIHSDLRPRNMFMKQYRDPAIYCSATLGEQRAMNWI